jgi:nitric oxide reductase activation protein
VDPHTPLQTFHQVGSWNHHVPAQTPRKLLSKENLPGKLLFLPFRERKTERERERVREREREQKRERGRKRRRKRERERETEREREREDNSRASIIPPVKAWHCAGCNAAHIRSVCP